MEFFCFCLFSHILSFSLSLSLASLISLFQQLEVRITEHVVKNVADIKNDITENVVKNVAELLPKPSESETNKTPAHLASNTEDALIRQKTSEYFKDVPFQPAILTKEQQDVVFVASKKSEENMVAHLTAHLWKW